MNPDDIPDKRGIDGDGVLDWLRLDSLAQNVINFTNVLARGYLDFELLVNDANLRYYLRPTGSAIIQIVVVVLNWRLAHHHRHPWDLYLSISLLWC